MTGLIWFVQVVHYPFTTNNSRLAVSSGKMILRSSRSGGSRQRPYIFDTEANRGANGSESSIRTAWQSARTEFATTSQRVSINEGAQVTLESKAKGDGDVVVMLCGPYSCAQHNSTRAVRASRSS